MEADERALELSEFKGTDDEYRALAKAEWEDPGQIEIDDNAPISRELDETRATRKKSFGAYVQAWVWVNNPEWK